MSRSFFSKVRLPRMATRDCTTSSAVPSRIWCAGTGRWRGEVLRASPAGTPMGCPSRSRPKKDWGFPASPKSRLSASRSSTRRAATRFLRTKKSGKPSPNVSVIGWTTRARTPLSTSATWRAYGGFSRNSLIGVSYTEGTRTSRTVHGAGPGSVPTRLRWGTVTSRIPLSTSCAPG